MKKIIVILMMAGICLSSCGGSDGGGDEPMPMPPEPVALTAAPILSLPVNNEPCSTFSTIPNDDTQIRVAFGWRAVSGAVSYEIQITDSNSGMTIIRTVTGTQVLIDVLRNTEYRWTVVGVNSEGIEGAISSEFSFTTPAQPMVNTAPYAVIDLQFDSDTDMGLLSWSIIDPDDDHVSDDVLIFEDDHEIENISGTVQQSIDPFFVIRSAVYRVEITSRDEQGNSYTSVQELRY